MLRKIDWDSQIGRRLKLRNLHVFFTVAQRGSMGKAAAQLGVSAPTVSEVIADLEHGLGVKLLDRSPQGVEPTMYGHALLKRGLAAFDELKQGIRDIEFLSDPTTGELRIGCSEPVSAAILPPIAHLFLQQYPRVVLHVNDVPPPTRELSGLRERKHDLILNRLVMPLSREPLEDDVNVELLFDDPLVVAAGRQTRWARRRKINLAELIDEPWILAPADTWNYTCVAEAFRALRLDMPKVNLMTLSVALRTYLLANGPYIAAFASSVLRLNADRYALKVLPVDLPIRPSPIVIATLKNRTLSPVVERFIACAREVVKPLANSRWRRGGGSPSAE